MLGGGIVMLPFGIATMGSFSPSWGSTLGWIYLVTFGSVVGYTAYVWLLANAPLGLVSTYAYVNPVVAVFLGWAFLSEPIGLRTILAGAIVLGSVALIITSGEATAAPEASSGGEPGHEGRDGVEGELALEGVGHAEHERLPEDRRRDLEPDG